MDNSSSIDSLCLITLEKVSYFEILFSFGDLLPKYCINKEADMLKNPCKSTRFYSDTRDRRFYLLCIPEKAGRPHGRAVRCRRRGFSSHLPPQTNKTYATGGITFGDRV